MAKFVKRLKSLTVAGKLIMAFSAVIMVFVAAFIYAAFSYFDLDRLHRHRFNHVAASTEHLLEFHRQFTELRLVIGTTFLSETWLESATMQTWYAADYEISEIYGNLHEISGSFADIIRENPLLTGSDETTRLDTIQSVMDYVSIIYGIFDDEFYANFFIEGNLYSLASISATASLFAASVENSLVMLRVFVESTHGEILNDIDYTVDVTLMGIIFVVLAAIAAAVLLAYLMIKAVIKMAIEKTQEAQELNRALIEAEPFAVMTWEISNGELVASDCNSQTLELFGVSDKKEILENFLKFSPEIQPDGISSKEKNEIVSFVAIEKGLHRFEWEHITAGGRVFPAEITLVRQQFQGKTFVFSYCVDIGELRSAIEKEQEEMLRREAAEEENRAKTKFLARMSHEIRTPMNAVMGITEIQLQKENHRPDTEEAFLRIYSSSSLLLSIINDILDLSKVEAGKMEIIEHSYEVASLIVDTVQLNLMHIGSKQIDFKLHVSENLPAHLIGDEMRVKQILNNLLSNAFKYTYEGSVNLSVEYEDETVIYRVKDTGQGMTEEQIEGLFEIEFTRFNMQTNRAIEGSGLGMSIAHQLIGMMNGGITVESEPGKGSVFTVRIPQKPEGDTVLGKEIAGNLANLETAQKSLKRLNKLNRLPMPYGRVLVVDDVESNIFVAKGLLLPYKLTIETVDSGPAAIKKIEDGNVYDIIFMDHMMPEMDGIEATQIIRGMGYERPIVALTANTVIGQADIFMENGFSGFISKPIDVNYLNACLLRFVRDAHPEEAAVYAAESVPTPSAELSREEMMSIFVRDAKKIVQVIETVEQNFDKNVMRLFIVNTHGIKSALANIGEAELSEKAFALETAGKAIRDEMPALLNSLRELIAQNYMQTRTAGEVSDDLDFLRGNLRVIAEACEEYDIEKAEDVLKLLRQTPFSHNTQNLLDDISEQLLLGEYEEAAKLCASEGI